MKKLVNAERLMELVNADAAELAKQLPYRDHAPYILAALRLKKILDGMDEAAAMCKTCIYAEIEGGATKYFVCKRMNSAVDPDGFCTYGQSWNKAKRKEDD